MISTPPASTLRPLRFSAAGTFPPSGLPAGRPVRALAAQHARPPETEVYSGLFRRFWGGPARVKTKRERLEILRALLNAEEPAESFETAFFLLERLLDEVENAHSGVRYERNPKRRNSRRMYMPAIESGRRDPETGVRVFETAAHLLLFAKNGAILIQRLPQAEQERRWRALPPKRRGALEWHRKPGRNGLHIWEYEEDLIFSPG